MKQDEFYLGENCRSELEEANENPNSDSLPQFQTASDPNSSISFFDLSRQLKSSKPVADNHRKKGRKVCEDSLILNQFWNKRGNYPKKEYIRCQLIRGHKRIIRNLLMNVIPNRTLNQFMVSKESSETWNRLKFAVLSHQEKLKILSQTIVGPLTEAQSKRKSEEKQGLSKSFNNNYCKQYFSTPEIKETFQKYIDYLFYGATLDDLCKKFRIRCCVDTNGHS